MRTTGMTFEIRACKALERAGLKCLARNYTTRHGELDLIMLDGDDIVFIEVRYRRHDSHGDATSSITLGKRAKLIRAAQLWLAAHPLHALKPCRFDVISYDGHEADARMHWLRGAFETQ